MTSTKYDDALRRAIQVAADARAQGNHPFGAILMADDGRVVLEAENTVVTGNDVTNHAETNLVREACQQFPRETLRELTLITSCEPCAMCAGAIFWAGISTVVYGLSESGLLDITGTDPDNPMLNLPCREVFAAGGGRTAVTGPLLEVEAAAPHQGFWRD